jgi:carbon monoxide dehydrogenase subunit G
VKIDARARCGAPPARVWEALADPARHLATLPSSIVDRSVREDGCLCGTLSAAGLRERLVVRLVEEHAGERLVAERIDGGRGMRTVFEISPDGDGTAIDATADVDVPFLAQAFARDPLRRGLEEQLAALCRTADRAGTGR